MTSSLDEALLSSIAIDHRNGDATIPSSASSSIDATNNRTPSSSDDDDINDGYVASSSSILCNSFVNFRCSPSGVVFVVSFALFVDLFLYALIIPVVPLFVKDKLGDSAGAVGLLFSCYAGGLLVFTPIVAILSDRLASRRAPMICGLIALAGSTILFGFARNLYELMLARTFQGISAAVTNTVGLAMVADVFPADKLSAAMGTVMAANGIGALIGPSIGGLLYKNVGFSNIFIVAGSVVGVDLILRLICIDEDWMKHRRRTIIAMVAAAAAAKNDNNDEEPSSAFDHSDSTFLTSSSSMQNDAFAQNDIDKQIARDNLTLSASSVPSPSYPLPRSSSSIPAAPLTIWSMCTIPFLLVSQIGVLMLAGIFTGIEPILALYYASEFGSTSDQIGYSYLAIAIPYIVSSVAISAVLELGYNRKRIVATGFVLMAAALPLLTLPHVLWLQIFPMMLLGIAIGCAITPPLSEIAEYLTATGNHTSFGQGYALFNLAYSIGMFVGPLATGYAYQYVSFFLVMMMLTGTAIAGAIMLFGYVQIYERKGKHAGEDKKIIVVNHK